MRLRPFGSCVATFALIVIAAGCGGDRRPALPRLPARAMEVWVETEGLRIAAQPYSDAEQQRQLFRRDLGGRHGLLPVFLVAQNTGSEPLLLRRRWIVLAPREGPILRASHSAETVDRALGDEGLDWDRAVGSPETLYNGRFDLGLAYLFGEALPSKVDAVHYANWQIPEETELAPGGRLRGFVYFEGRSGSAPAASGTLTVRFRKAGGLPNARPSRSAGLLLGARGSDGTP